MLLGNQGRIHDFKIGGAHLKKLRRAEGGAKFFWVFRVKNHDFTPKKIRFFPNAEGSAKIFGVFRVKNHDFTPTNLIFSYFRGAGWSGAPGAPPWIRPWLHMSEGKGPQFYQFLHYLVTGNFNNEYIL